MKMKNLKIACFVACVAMMSVSGPARLNETGMNWMPVTSAVAEDETAQLRQQGNDAYNAENYEEAVKWYTRAAVEGDAEAQRMLGVCYEYGRGVTQDEFEAFNWYGKSAAQGNAKAQNSVGFYYGTGRVVDQDYTKAVEWYTKSAEQGYEVAQCNLGLYYENGRGVEQDYVKAVGWYTESAEQGYAAA